ncbi:hypothetical protein CFC21_014453 [Triticum aestivum]|uniref:Sulfotransferase n=2 Tax=Triticum aestivum TaxID=4565 RepID=A0A3B6U8L0_WHEAT|nr:hypothetical protein CFC21_014453 [Triticum aestivum]
MCRMCLQRTINHILHLSHLDHTICLTMSSFSLRTPQESGAKINRELYQKFTNVVSSLPCSPALTRHPLYRHDSGWYAPLAPMVSTMVADACFSAHPWDIVIATMPKSCTTWIKAMLYSMVHRREHPTDRGLGELSVARDGKDDQRITEAGFKGSGLRV